MLGGRILAVAFTLVSLSLGPIAEATTLSVNCAAGGDLQAKIDAASSGDTILVKGTCVGNFIITSKGLTLKGNPAATLDGNDVFRPLGVNNTGAPSASVHLTDLIITGGVVQSPGGGGILKIGGGLTLTKVTVTANLATSSSGPVAGGGVFAGGNLTLTDSTISDNRARTTGSGGEADGGGIAVVGGNLTVGSSKITANRATAVLSSGNADARGGGIYLSTGKLTLKRSTASGNRVTASGPGNADADGGAVFKVSGSAEDFMSGSVVTKNAATAIAPSGAAGAAGSGLSEDIVHVLGSTVSTNVTSASGSTATASGAGVFTERTVTLTRSTVNGNRVQATATGGHALGEGGGLVADNVLPVIASTVSRNTVTATTSAAAEAGANGGGVSSSGVDITNSTIALNALSATSPSVGGTSTADGGGIESFSGNPSPLVDSTVAGNVTAASGGTVERRGGGIYASPILTLEATIVANNTAIQGPDCFGGPTSNGHNLIRNPTGCSFTKKSTDKVGKNPKLGPLQNHGGPTQTMAIAPTSPAFNAIPKAACAVTTDQRGVHRPQDLRCDIGAYELRVRSIAIA
jgi:hypothetical protein